MIYRCLFYKDDMAGIVCPGTWLRQVMSGCITVLDESVCTRWIDRFCVY